MIARNYKKVICSWVPNFFILLCHQGPEVKVLKTIKMVRCDSIPQDFGQIRQWIMPYLIEMATITLIFACLFIVFVYL